MIRLAAIVATVSCGLCGLATPSFATEWVNCADAAGAATFSYLAGTLDVLSIAGLNISVGDKVWASDVVYGPGDPVVVGQAFETADTVLIDAMLPDMTAKIAELRLFKATEGDISVSAGTLRMPGQGAWAVSCSAGE
jgi:hypothetical protein